MAGTGRASGGEDAAGSIAGFAAGPDLEAQEIDRLVDLLLVLEPFEVKQHGAAGADGEPAGGGDDAEVDRPSAESTRAMLMQMRAVLDREAGRLGQEGLEGKAAVDQVALIARTLEKIDQMERLIAEDQARTRSQTLSIEEREQMRQTVRQLILAAAERMVAEREDTQAAQGETEAGNNEDGSPSRAPRLPDMKESSDPADAGSLDPGSSPG
ncbi:hypothetical protein [Hoeflea sp.]|uniref:hypothetical protein n=1 Tax=Hoeflea sp. TaxID=1940281 RepID=UPI003749F3F6